MSVTLAELRDARAKYRALKRLKDPNTREAYLKWKALNKEYHKR